MVAVYLCESNEENIDNMSYNFFNQILKFLNKRLNYDAAVGYAGNGFVKDSASMIKSSNPFIDNEDKMLNYGEQMAALINTGTIKIVKGNVEKGMMDDYGITMGKSNN